MNRRARDLRDTLYRRLNFIELRDANEGDRSEARALSWALRLIEEAEALGLMPQLEASNTFSTAAWVKRRAEIDERERKKRERRENRLATLQALNESPDFDDAMYRRVPGSYESGRRR